MATETTREIRASRSAVYAALLDPALVATWRFPSEMTCQVHHWDAVEGGTLRATLTYDDTSRQGKSGQGTDTYTGRFERLVPNELVVEVDSFESDDPALTGDMTMTLSLSDVPIGTLLHVRHDDLPATVSEADNLRGWEEALDRLTQLLESPLSPLLGAWSFTMHHREMTEPVHGRQRFEPVLDSAFVLLHWHYDHPDFPDAKAFLSPTSLHYFDVRGVTRVFDLTIDHERWSIVRRDSDMWQRAETRFAGGDVMIGTGDLSHDGGRTWERDYDIEYRRSSSVVP